jgi:hypothetical protein
MIGVNLPSVRRSETTGRGRGDAGGHRDEFSTSIRGSFRAIAVTTLHKQVKMNFVGNVLFTGFCT